MLLRFLLIALNDLSAEADSRRRERSSNDWVLVVLPQGWFSLRSLGAVGKADPLTLRHGGPLLKLARGVAVIEQLKGEGE